MVTMFGLSYRLMTLMLWKTFTPSLLMHRPPQVLYMLLSHSSAVTTDYYAVHTHRRSFSVSLRLLQCFQVSTAATLKTCLGLITGLQEYRYGLNVAIVAMDPVNADQYKLF